MSEAEAEKLHDIIWECIYDHGGGKYRGAVSKAQRERARQALDELREAATRSKEQQ